MKTFISPFLTAFALLAGIPGGQAQPLELAPPFTDGAILQREKEVPVWGWSAPGSKVEVAFAGQTKITTADEFGNWKVKLEPLEASAEERELTVRKRERRVDHA